MYAIRYQFAKRVQLGEFERVAVPVFLVVDINQHCETNCAYLLNTGEAVQIAEIRQTSSSSAAVAP